MKKTCSKQKIMCQSKLYLFTTKKHVSTKTPLIHFQEVCSHKELRRYETTHSLFNLFFTSIQSFKPLMSWSILATWRIKLHSSPLSTRTTWLQLFYDYNPFAISKHLFYNGKKKIHNNGHTKHLGNNDWIHFNFKHTKWNMRNDKKHHFNIQEIPPC
jgi:hypothetical protein